MPRLEDPSGSIEAVGRRCGCFLDHASYRHSYGGKIGVDATAKTADEGYTRGWPQVARMSAAVKQRVDDLWNSLGL